MVATAGGSGSGEPDMALVGELLEAIQRNPPAIAARKVLVEHYIAIGWLDAAIEETNELRRLTGPDSEVDGFIAILSRKPAPPAPLTPPSTSKPAATWYPSQPTKSSKTSRKLPARPAVNMLPSEVDETRKDLTENYPTLRSKAKALFSDLLRLKALQKKYGMSHSDNLSRIQAIAEGRVDGTPTTSGPPGSARSVARMIQTTPDRATEMAIADLEDMTHWLREPHGRASGVDDDSVRDSLVKRMHAVQLALPEDLKLYPEIALMHIQHEQLAKTYVNDETMLGDAIKDIPRDNFWVTEDNYAWDMEELVQAITANGGVMRNPLSRQMFTPKDIRGIVKHPKGKALQALQVAQHEMAKGVRPDTITQMDKLATILLEDQSADTLPSRHAVDEFMAYVATLPEVEQKALDGLKCPAKDSHTGQSYDFSVGEAVRDAQGNRVCFHKTGDFIKQAAAHLRKNRGAA